MKKLIIGLSLIAMSSAVYSSCYWSKIAEVKGQRGVICTWKCGYGSQAIHTTTSGIAYCPRPR